MMIPKSGKGAPKGPKNRPERRKNWRKFRDQLEAGKGPTVWLLSQKMGIATRSKLASFLSPSETEKLSEIKSSETRDAMLIGRGFTRFLLAQYLGTPPPKVVIEVEEKGRPYARNRLGLDFNVSHSGGLVAVAISLQGKVGIDFEKARRLPDQVSLASQILSEDEMDDLYVTGPLTSSKIFYDYWTAKESVLKCDGRGLSIDPREVEICFEKNLFQIAAAEELQLPKVKGWRIPFLNGFQGFVATLGNSDGPQFFVEAKVGKLMEIKATQVFKLENLLQGRDEEELI